MSRRFKLTNEQILSIHKDTRIAAEIAKEYGISEDTVIRIRTGTRTYAFLGSPPRPESTFTNKSRKSIIPIKKFKTLEETFNYYCSKGLEDECWVWLGRINTQGYCLVYSPELGKDLRAHRVSYALKHGIVLDPSVSVCHGCDNTTCVNPKHLFIGTHKSNMEDKYSKNRQARQCARKLNKNQVIEIKTALRLGETMTSLAERFNVHLVTITDIKSGKSWKYVGN